MDGWILDGGGSRRQEQRREAREIRDEAQKEIRSISYYLDVINIIYVLF